MSAFLGAVVARTAKLETRPAAAVGWFHGAMTNMSILGLTSTMGPMASWTTMTRFICNHSDHNGRYAFNQQPYIGLWNLSCLAQTLLPLAEKDDLKAALDTYQGHSIMNIGGWRGKMGLRENGTTTRICSRWIKGWGCWPAAASITQSSS
ncbi:MAG: protein adenylyltransferase SelO family protein [Nitrospiraceae bacterium]